MWYRQCFVSKHGFRRELLNKTELQYDIQFHPDIQKKATTHFRHHAAKRHLKQDNRGYGVCQHIPMGCGTDVWLCSHMWRIPYHQWLGAHCKSLFITVSVCVLKTVGTML
jgi:hypothetical protein